MLFYQALTAVVSEITSVPYSFAAYSFKGFLFTIVLVTAVFALSSVASAVYLGRVNIISLIKGERKPERQVRHPAFWLTVAAVSLIAVVVGCVFFNKSLKNVIGTDSSIAPLTASLGLLAVAIILLHVGLAKSLFPFLLRAKKFKNVGTNSFTLRALSAKTSADAVMMGLLAFLVSFAIIGANLSFVLRSFNDRSLARDYPFDIFAETDANGDSPITETEADEIISSYASVKSRVRYSIYDSGTRTLLNRTEWAGYESLTDLYITESDFARFCGALGQSVPSAVSGYRIVASDGYFDKVAACDFSGTTLSRGGQTLGFAGFVRSPLIKKGFFAAIVPDSFTQSAALEYVGLIYSLSDRNFDAAALHDALSYERNMGNFSISLCDFDVREYARLQLNAQNAVFVIAALYIAFVFVLLSMAILALKVLSDIADNRRRFDTLYKIGASSKDLRRSLFRQTFAFFFLPFAAPLLLSIPAGVASATVMTLTGFSAAISHTVAGTAMIALIVAAVYALYFSATYLCAKRSVLPARF